VLSLEDSQTNNKLARAIVDRGYADGSIKSPWEKLYTRSSVPSTSIPEIQDPGYKSAEGIFQTNGLPVGNSNSLGLFPLISRFNHSAPTLATADIPRRSTSCAGHERYEKPGEEILGL
jgi:hypothetical protein